MVERVSVMLIELFIVFKVESQSGNSIFPVGFLSEAFPRSQQPPKLNLF